MSHSHSQPQDAPTLPARPLRADFTTQTLQKAIAARRRHSKPSITQRIFYERSIMNFAKFTRTLPGAAAIALVIGTGTFTTYAATSNWSNWFDTGVSVQPTSDPSIVMVSTTGCEGATLFDMPLGDKIAYKVESGTVTQKDIEQRLLPFCELNTINNFYKAKYPNLVSTFNYPKVWPNLSAMPKPGELRYTLVSGIVKSIAPTVVTLQLTDCPPPDVNIATGWVTPPWAPCKSVIDFPLASDATFYDQGKSIEQADFKSGDTVTFVASTPFDIYNGNRPVFEWPGQGANLTEKTQIASLFKTEYDLRHVNPYVPNALPYKVYLKLQEEAEAYKKAMQDPILRQK